MSEATQYHVFETAMGFCAIAWSEAGIARFQLPVKSAEAADRLMRRRALDAEPQALSGEVAAVVAAAKRYFDGEEMDFSQVRLDLAAEDPFFAQIYAALRRVGWGRTTTYGALAKEVGAPPRSGARCRRGDGQESGAVDRSLSPGLGRRRQDRRFLGARRLENEGSDAGAGRRSGRAAGSRATIFQFLSRTVALAEPACQAAHSA